jgi:hypothetical protein
VRFRHERRGRPGSATRYPRDEKPVVAIIARVRADTPPARPGIRLHPGERLLK